MTIQQPTQITREDIQRALVARAETFAATKGISLSRLSVLIAGDGKFLPKVKAGANFTVDRYQEVVDRLAALENQESASVSPQPEATRP